MEKKLRVDEVEKALYIIDMNNGFVNEGAMANPSYNGLVNEQLKTVREMREENGIVNFILEGHSKESVEFLSYPEHCVLGTKEALLIPELLPLQRDVNTYTYYKNCINGMLIRKLQNDIKRLTKLKVAIFEGVCGDLCVMDFARTYARFLDQINRKVTLFAVKSAIDTFDSPDHNRKEWLDIAYKVMAQAGIIVVENYEELREKERTLSLKR